MSTMRNYIAELSDTDLRDAANHLVKTASEQEVEHAIKCMFCFCNIPASYKIRETLHAALRTLRTRPEIGSVKLGK